MLAGRGVVVIFLAENQNKTDDGYGSPSQDDQQQTSFTLSPGIACSYWKVARVPVPGRMFMLLVDGQGSKQQTDGAKGRRSPGRWVLTVVAAAHFGRNWVREIAGACR